MAGERDQPKCVGSFATPGGWVRIVGEAINLGGGSGTPSVLRLEGGSVPALVLDIIRL